MLRRNILANYLGQGWTALMGLVFIPVYIKYLGIEAYGLIGLFTVIQTLFGLLETGLTPALARAMARFTGGGYSPQSIRNLLRSVEIIACGLILFILLLGVGIADWAARYWFQVNDTPSDVIAQAVIIMALVTGLRLLESIYKSSIVGLQRQVMLNTVVSMLATFRWLGAALILAWVSPTVNSFFIWQGVSSVLAVAVLVPLTYRLIPATRLNARFSWTALRGLGSFAGGVCGISILALILTQFDKLILSRLLPLSDYGYYMLAATLAGGLYTLISPISTAYYPRLCELRERGEDAAMIDAFHAGAQLVSVIAGSAALVIVVFADTLLHLWTQDHSLAQKAGPLLSVLALGNLLNALMWIPGQAQLAHGWTSLAIKTNIVAVLLVIPAILVVTPSFGAIGAAWIWVGLNAGYFLISVQFMFRRILQKEKLHWYFIDVLCPLVPAAAVALSLSVVVDSKHDSWIKLGIIVTATCLAVIVAGVCADRVRADILRIFTVLLRIKSERRP